ncbi:eukaryotic translation initiation factor 4E1-like [Adelges cooleyi]|uniref:eukaryotic translation initiation factor 4E1-like n=1 Tax=Adelges cooleyi TaxID=133065 RepID=UPI00217FA32E|nr:eukaryotic translation initiation factor 4E1-like [Adelges cooleyi]
MAASNDMQQQQQQQQQQNQTIEFPLTFNWTLWCKECSGGGGGRNDEDWMDNVHELFGVSTDKQFLAAYKQAKLPTALPLGYNYYFFKKGIMPMWEAAPNKGAGAWVVLLQASAQSADLNFIWSDMLFMLVSGDIGHLAKYICGVTCNVRRSMHKVALWTVKTTASNYEYILEIGKIWHKSIANVYRIKYIKYRLHEGVQQQEFDYAL